uniref:Uncharacterized protein n=1 Tax=Parascaris equorum TaxID=6256 RepID=A0A914RTD5_PAREQ
WPLFESFHVAVLNFSAVLAVVSLSLFVQPSERNIY